MRRPLAILALLLAGCAGGDRLGGDPTTVQGFMKSLEHTVAPFMVTDHRGATIDEPFLGGFNVPRPQFVDIDGDGDLDLFVQEVAGDVKFFERAERDAEPAAARPPDGESGPGAGTDPAIPVFRWRTDRYADLDVGEWYRFVDLDADGDLDVMGEQLFSHIRAYRNVGDRRRAQFEIAADTLRGADGAPIFSDRQNIPQILDLDCDGRLDMFLGQINGTVTRYESVSSDEDGLPRFRHVTDQWEGIEIIGMMASRHGANTLSFGDADGDGDLDLFWGDFFEPGILLIRNRGTCAAPDFKSKPEPFPPGNPFRTSGYNAPAPADLDGDGDLDMAVGVLGGAFNSNRSIVENLYLLLQDSPSEWRVATGRLLPTIDAGSDSVPRLVDLDRDGDLDLLVANKIEPLENETGSIHVYENVGTAARPSLAAREPLRLVESFHQSPAPGDLDGDGLVDLLVGRWNRQVDFWHGAAGSPATGTATGAAGSPALAAFEPIPGPYLELTRGSNASPALVDIDADGDLDLFLGEASGTLNFYRNEGTSTEPRFVLVSDEWNGWKLGRRTVPAFGDLDYDGDFDLLVGTDLAGILVFENVGSPTAALFEARGPLPLRVPALSAPEVGDLDGDGDLDLLIGGMAGGLLYFENTGGR